MAHQDPASLWAYANGELDAVKMAAVEAHLAQCDACQVALVDVQETSALLKPFEPPPLSETAWRGIDEAVLDHAAKELGKPKGILDVIASWLPAVPAPVLVTAGLALLVVGGFFYLRTPSQGTLHEEPTVVAQKSAEPEAKPEVEERPTVQAPKFVESRVASVVNAKRAKLLNGAKLAKGAEVGAGGRVKTEAGGDAWLQLPDGSRTGVLARTDVSFVSLAPSDVKILLDQGSIVVAAAKHKQHEFAVESHGVEVHVVGTHFLVSRNGSETDVAVEEGAVEVTSPLGTNRVEAGSRLVVHDDGGLVAERQLTKSERGEFKSLASSEEPPHVVPHSKTLAMVERQPVESGTPPIPPLPVPAAEAPPERVAVAVPPPSSKLAEADDSDSASVGIPSPPPTPRVAVPPNGPTYTPPPAPVVPPPPMPPPVTGVYVLPTGSQQGCSPWAYARARGENMYEKRINRAPWRDNRKIEEVWVHMRCLQIDRNFPEAAKEGELFNSLIRYQQLGYIIR
jgi:hypothetical protein